MSRLASMWTALTAQPLRRVQWVTWAIFVVPFLVAAVVLWTRHYHPVLDLAMTEFRVRDVGGRHSPLIGLPGRIGIFPDQGSHPGPLSFYLLAPTYRLLGASAWGLLVGMIVLNLVALGVVLWLAGRRGGVAMVLAVAALLAVLVRGYGFEVVTQPWNPYLPILLFLVVLLAVWGVLLDDRIGIVVIAVAGSICAQTHLPYLGLTLGMAFLAICVLIVRAVRTRAERRNIAAWIGGAAGAALVLWLPPIVDQLRRDPGNLAMLRDYFRSPPEEPVGVAEGARLLLRHLDPTRFIGALTGADGWITRAGYELDGSVVPGLVLLAVWVASVVVVVRRRHRMLVMLDAVIAWSMVLAVISMSRIFGKVWYYLTLWAWLTTALVIVSIVWTVIVVLRGRRARTALAVAVAVVGIGSWAALTVEAVGATAPEQYLSDTLRAVTGPTVDAIEQGVGGTSGHDGTYLVTWSDARYFGSQGYGLVNELERRGYDVGVLNTWRVPVTPQRVLGPGQATVQLRLVTGVFIDQVAALPGAVELVQFDPRDAAALREYEELETSVTDALVADGLADLVPMIDTNLFGLQIDPRVSTDVQRMVDRMLHLGTPTAVFALPAETPL
ncbi:MAG: hypothetical protein ACOYL9_10245 [Ilumatobacteraceae bacterium]